MGSVSQSKNGVKVSIGNKKLGKDTVVLNMCSAADCPSAKLGFCQFGKKCRKFCYAGKAERQYPQVLPYRRYQQKVWNKLSADDIADGLIQIATRRRNTKIKYLRFSEAGDFSNQADVGKVSRIADRLSAIGVKEITRRRNPFTCRF